MKKTYQKPEMLIVEVRAEQQLLAASGNQRMRVTGLDEDFDYDETEGNGWDAW